jgi:Fe-S-cluster containining protein
VFLVENEEFDKDPKKHPLSSGIPCREHKCVKCCIETRMPVSIFDIKRISDTGYKFKNFVVKRGKERYLKNVKGQCVFLDYKGCTIYFIRPRGCLLYPLILYKNSVNAVIHSFCPYKNEFKFNNKDIENLKMQLKDLE